MQRALSRLPARLIAATQTIAVGPQVLVFVPAITLIGFWFGGETLLLFMALALPAAMGFVALLNPTGDGTARPGPRDAATGLPLIGEVTRTLDAALAAAGDTGCRTACLVLELDEAQAMRHRFGDSAADLVLRSAAIRLGNTLREGDVLARHGETSVAIALAPVRRIDLEAMIQLAARLQAALNDPVEIGAHKLHLTACIGFCLPRRPDERTGPACLTAAEAALAEAQRCGPGSIRSFVPRQTSVATSGAGLGEEVAVALDAGQIVAWFQPQISTDTGMVSGMEALARWEHPDRGVLLPGVFLPAIAAGGLQRQLTETMVQQSLKALAAWDADGLDVPAVAVNFSGEDLADPLLAERIKWELDRNDIPPGRFAVEVLETVISTSDDDAAARTISQLAEMGCRIDLDDFGTGHAAIANIRRFHVNRIKIDRSFVVRIDSDPDQQTMLTAILDLAQRLDIETLAEGVETVGEHALLAQLGCGHVQGYSIARPSGFDDTSAWLRRHRDTRARAIWPDRQTG